MSSVEDERLTGTLNQTLLRKSMRELIKNTGRRILSVIGMEAFGRLFFQNSALKQLGWFESVRTKESIDSAGNAQPWFTYPFLAFFEERLQRDFKLFEFGAGQSTLYYAKILSVVHAVEHDPSWHSKIIKANDEMGGVARIRLEKIPAEHAGKSLTDVSFVEETNDYVSSISEYGLKYDVVVVDGLFRNSCATNCVNYLSDDGVIVVDNTHNETEMKSCSDALADLGFKRLDFFGMCAIFSQLSCTSVFYRSKNCFKI